MTKIIKQRSLPSQIEEAEDHGGEGVNEREAGRGEKFLCPLTAEAYGIFMRHCSEAN